MKGPGGVLKDQLHGSELVPAAPGRQRLSPQQQLAGIRRLQAADQPQQCAFAAAALSGDAQYLSGLQCEGHPIQRLHRAIASGQQLSLQQAHRLPPFSRGTASSSRRV